MVYYRNKLLQKSFVDKEAEYKERAAKRAGESELPANPSSRPFQRNDAFSPPSRGKKEKSLLENDGANYDLSEESDSMNGNFGEMRDEENETSDNMMAGSISKNFGGTQKVNSTK